MTNEVSTLPNYIFDKLTGWRLNLPTHIEPGSRVLALYRVSTDKQLYHTEENDADIPMAAYPLPGILRTDGLDPCV